jgi:hypothetical protein
MPEVARTTRRRCLDGRRSGRFAENSFTMSKIWRRREPGGETGTLRVRALAPPPQTISVPPRSVAGLAPTCSMRRSQLVPRK